MNGMELLAQAAGSSTYTWYAALPDHKNNKIKKKVM